MARVARVRLAIAGVLNHHPFGAGGTLNVDEGAGTKDGAITYTQPPTGVTVGADSTVASTGRCFVGARPSHGSPSLGPLHLLGSEFASLRVADLGRFGTVSIGERGRISGGVLTSELTAVGEYRVPVVRGMGPLRETITVSRDGSMVGVGRYTLTRSRGRPISVRYIHYYRPARPNHRLFARLHGKSFVLRASITVRVRGRTLEYHSRSTISPAR